MSNHTYDTFIPRGIIPDRNLRRLLSSRWNILRLYLEAAQKKIIWCFIVLSVCETFEFFTIILVQFDEFNEI